MMTKRGYIWRKISFTLFDAMMQNIHGQREEVQGYRKGWKTFHVKHFLFSYNNIDSLWKTATKIAMQAEKCS